MEAGANHDNPSSGRGKPLLIILGALLLGAIVILVVNQLNKDDSNDSSTENASSAPVLFIPDSSLSQNECPQPLDEPSEIKLGCGKLPLTDLDWSNWGSPAATASGTAHLNDCRPDCARGTLREFPITVALTRIETCKANGQRRYLTMSVTYLSGKHPDFSDNYRCPETEAQKKSDANAQLIAELAIKAKGGTINPELLFVNRSGRDPHWVQVSGSTLSEPSYGWTVDLKSDQGKWIVRYAGFDEESETGESHHYVAGLPCDLDFSQGYAAC